VIILSIFDPRTHELRSRPNPADGHVPQLERRSRHIVAAGLKFSTDSMEICLTWYHSGNCGRAGFGARMSSSAPIRPCYLRRVGKLKAFIVAAAFVLAEPAAAQDIVCHDPLKPMLRAELFFGRAMAGGQRVSAAQWARYVARELTPRFPDGLTVLDGQGQWRDGARGVVVREPSTVVIVVTANDASARAALTAAAEAYKQRFKQKSVGIVTRPVCAAF
jgi:hypothetical protein